MNLVLDPSNSMDAAGYEGIRNIVGINSTDSQINGNPIFLRAENFIVGSVLINRKKIDSRRCKPVIYRGVLKERIPTIEASAEINK